MSMTIDGIEYEYDTGQKVLDVAMENDLDIPTLCFNPLNDDVRPAGCRLCVVEVIEGGRPGIQSSCTMPASDGLSVSTHSEAVYNLRREVIILLLSEHEQKCRDCQISGDCSFAKLCRDYDINGVSVCAECPNRGDGCLLSRGELCLGPITYANCNAYCTRKGYRCEGCHTVMANEDVLRFGLKAYEEKGFGKQEILDAAKVFSFDSIDKLEKIMILEGF